MSNKNKQLLNESTVRRFMGLAGIGALSDNTVGKLQEQDELEAPPEEDPMADMPDDMPPMDDEAPMDDESADVDLTSEEAEVIIGLGEKLKAEMGDEEMEGDDMGDMGDELAPEGEAGPPMPPMPPEEEGPVMQEAFVRELSNRVAQRVAHTRTINEELSHRVAGRIRKEQIINETMKRVAKRLTPRRRRRRR